MRRTRFLLAATLAALPTISTAQIYRCESAGRTLYSDSPCTERQRERDRIQAPPSTAGSREEQIMRAKIQQIEDQKNTRQAQIKAIAETAAAEAKARRDRWIAENPQSPEQLRRMVRIGIVDIGMPSDAVRAALGEPDSHTTTVTRGGTLEFWHYRSDYQSMMIHFTNGVVDSYQQ